MIKYDLVTRILHWIMALIIICLCIVGLLMGDIDRENPLRGQLYMMHKSFGTIILMLSIVRIFWGIKNALPLPDTIQGWQRTLSKAVKHSLYLLILLVPLSGFLMSHTAGYPVNFFGLFTLPQLVPESEAVADFMHEAHEILAYLIIAMIVLHITGAVKHRLAGKEEDVLQRML